MLSGETLVEGVGATGSCHEDTGVTTEVGDPRRPAGPQKNPRCYDLGARLSQGRTWWAVRMDTGEEEPACRV